MCPSLALCVIYKCSSTPRSQKVVNSTWINITMHIDALVFAKIQVHVNSGLETNGSQLVTD